jgi:hypothetical protein
MTVTWIAEQNFSAIQIVVQKMFDSRKRGLIMSLSHTFTVARRGSCGRP